MLSIAERAQQLKEMKNMVSKVISPEVRRSLDKSKVTELPEKSPIQIQPQPSVMTTTNPVTNPPKVVSHGNLFEKISKQFSPPPKSLLKKSSALNNKVQELVQKNAESIIKVPMPGPSNLESSLKADLAAEGDVEVVDVDNILTPSDKIDLTMDDLAFDVVKPSIAETSHNIEQKDTAEAANQDKVENVGEKVSNAPLVVSDQAVDTSLHELAVKPETQPMEKPSTKEVEKVDFDAFILEKTKATEAFQEEFILDEEVTPKILPHIPEKLTRKRVTRESTLYFVKWQGLPKTANTWENLLGVTSSSRINS